MIQNVLKKIVTRQTKKTLPQFFRLTNTFSHQFYQKSRFSSNNKIEEEQDSHNDFKPQSKQQITDENVLKMVDDWVKNNKVVLFMKGVPQMPQCGFSNYVVQILKFYNIKNFKAVNILENNVLREGVKKYSNWPTYPQLYVSGSLVGKITFFI